MLWVVWSVADLCTKNRERVHTILSFSRYDLEERSNVARIQPLGRYQRSSGLGRKHLMSRSMSIFLIRRLITKSLIGPLSSAPPAGLKPVSAREEMRVP